MSQQHTPLPYPILGNINKIKFVILQAEIRIPLICLSSFCNCILKRVLFLTSKDCFSSSLVQVCRIIQKRQEQNQPTPAIICNFGPGWATLKGECAFEIIKNRLLLGEKKGTQMVPLSLLCLPLLPLNNTFFFILALPAALVLGFECAEKS